MNVGVLCSGGSHLCGIEPAWHPSALSPHLQAMLRAGAIPGETERLRAVLRSLRRGNDSVLVTALGASVTADYGGAVGHMQDRFLLGYSGMPSQIRGAKVKPGWLLPIGDFLFSLGRRSSGSQSTRGGHRIAADAGNSDGMHWLAAPNATSPSNVQLVNAACAGHKLDHYLTCLATKVPLDTNLFLVDAATVPQSMQSAEQVVRSLLALPNNPAVLFVHFANWCWHQNQNDPDTRREHFNRSCYAPRRAVSLWRKANEYETQLDELTAYYALPSVSLRRAFGRAALHGGEDAIFRPWELTGDGLHPQRPGCHTSRFPGGCKNERYSQLAAAMVNSFLWDQWNLMLADEQRHERAIAAAEEEEASAAGAAQPANGLRRRGAVRRRASRPSEGEEGARLGFFPCLSLFPPHTTAGNYGDIERCFAWGPVGCAIPPSMAQQHPPI